MQNITNKKNYRPMSSASRLWTAVGEVWPPFCVQMNIEGEGIISLQEMKHAVKLASEANPGARLVRRGILSASRWIDSGVTPRVREVDGSDWTGLNQENAPFLMDRLDIDKGPSCEVLLVRGASTRLIFRTHHAVMDARGTIVWAEDIFRILRGEKPVGSDFLATEDDFLNFSETVEKPLPQNYIIPSVPADSGSGYVWRRRKIEGKFSNLLPQLMCLTAKEAWKNGDGKIRIGVPVDLRSRRPGFRSTSNLTNAIFFNIEKDTVPEQLARDMHKRLEEQNDGVTTWEDHIIKYIPIPILKKAINNECLKSRKTGNYRYTAFLSNLGKIALEPFSTPGYKAGSVFFIPQCNEWIPFFMTAQGNDSGTEIILTMPVFYGGNGKIDVLMDNIIKKLEKVDVPVHA